MQLDFYTNVSRVGNHICVRGIRNGKEVRFKDKYQPMVYFENDKDFGYRSLYGQSLKPVQFDSMRDVSDFAKEHRGSNLKFYGFPYFHSQYTLENFEDTVTKFEKKYIRTFNIDIEVTSTAEFPTPEEAKYPITAMCIYDSVADKFVTFGIGEWDKEDSILPDDVSHKVMYVACKDEHTLLSKFLGYWSTFTPQIVTGWNIETFDMPYIVNRITNLGLDANRLSPWSKTNIRSFRSHTGNEAIAANIMGVDIIDYLAMYRRNRIQESYRLDYIAQVELGERKSLGTMEMLDMSRTPFVDTPPVNVYDETDDEEFNRFARLRRKRVETGDTILIKEEKKAAFQAFISYNIQDVNLVKRLDEKMGLLDAQIMIAYEACMNYTEVMSPVRTWDCLINKEMFKSNQIPHFDVVSEGASGGIPGGHVKDPQVGKHGWCASFDLNSLYPHLIMQFNVSPEKLDHNFKLWEYESDENRVQRLLNKEEFKKDDGYAIAASGYRFKTDEMGIVPRLMKKLYDERKAFKKKMLHADNELQKIKGTGDPKVKELEREVSLNNLRQYVMKILLNSGYGAFINQYFRWYDRRLGMSITLSGQFVIQVAEREINKWMNKLLKTENVDYIIAIDTDSNYVNLQPLVDKFFPHKTTEELIDIVDRVAQDQIQKVLDEGFDDAADYLNAFEQKMVMEREAIASSAFWVAKKRYAMLVHDMEGVRMPLDKPKIKVQGLDAIRSSTPYACREPLMNIIKKTLSSDEKEVQDYIAEFKKEFMEMPIEQIAMPKTMNNINKYTVNGMPTKGTPPHVRGAIMFNNMLVKHNLANFWEKMNDGEKGKFVYLRQPNNVGSDVISFLTSLPTEFDVEKHIDREKMFEKIIIDPASNVLDPIGWSAIQRLTLEDFFG